MFEFTDAEFRIIMFICRQTFGWQRESTIPMSISFIGKGTGMSRQGVVNGCFRLKEKRLLEKVPVGNSFSFNLLVNAVDQSTPLHEIVQRRCMKSYNAVDTKKETIEKKETKEQGDQVQLPKSLDTPEFIEAWTDWEEHRKQSKKKLTPLATSKQLKMLSEIGSARAVAAINHSIANGYQGIYENRSGNSAGNYRKPVDRNEGTLNNPNDYAGITCWPPPAAQ